MMRQRVFVVLASVMAAASLMAQRGPGGPRSDGPMDPQKMVERRVEALTDRLALTASQQQQAKTIFTEEATATTALQPKMAEARQALQTAITTTGLDADIERAAAQQGTVSTQMATIRGKSQAKFRAILTPEQKEKLDSSRGPGFGMNGGGPRMGGRF